MLQGQGRDWSEAWNWPRIAVRSGGNSLLWRAKDPRGGKSVAIKWNRVSGESDKYNRNVANVEEEVLRACRHPNLIELHDARDELGRRLLMLEWLDGKNLDQISKWDLPLQRAVKIVRATGLALSEMHDHGFVHGDISPANVMCVSGPSDVKVIDLAFRNLDGRSCPRFCASGGTMGFKAPEKEEKYVRVVDRRVDVYSVGQLLRFLTEGIVSLAHTLHRSRVNKVIDRACAFDPNQRYKDMPTMLAALPSI